jgi:transcriptional regulator of acetoin/glycerol metabolism
MTPLRRLEDLEKEAILEAIISTGSVRKAAEELGIDRNTIYRKLKRYDLALKANQIFAELRKQRSLPIKS